MKVNVFEILEYTPQSILRETIILDKGNHMSLYDYLTNQHGFMPAKHVNVKMSTEDGYKKTNIEKWYYETVY